jgi:hypothetical protein
MLVLRSRVARAIDLVERQAASTCAYCHDPLSADPRACGCGAAYHLDCWLELGRCGTLGCTQRPCALDLQRSGVCPGCRAPAARTLPWERAECACGAIYHLGCRMLRRRCVTPGCPRGDHDGWGHAPVVAPRGLLASLALALGGALLPRGAVQCALTGGGATLLVASLTVLERGDRAAALAMCGLSLVGSLGLGSRRA